MITEEGYVRPDTIDMQIETLVRNTLSQAVRKHGKKFNSPHEAYAVIKEEIEEVEEQFELMKMKFECMWELIKLDQSDSCAFNFEMDYMRDAGIKLITEALQAVAMLDKYENSFKEVEA